MDVVLYLVDKYYVVPFSDGNAPLRWRKNQPFPAINDSPFRVRLISQNGVLCTEMRAVDLTTEQTGSLCQIQNNFWHFTR